MRALNGVMQTTTSSQSYPAYDGFAGQNPAEVVTRAVREFEQTREWRRDVLRALEDAMRSLTDSDLSRALARATTSA